MGNAQSGHHRRSLANLIELMTVVDERGIGFKSLTEQIDTTTSGGKLIFHILGP
jgi:DNA invertase Pin-like site-specific DNA recombinase